MKRMDLCLTYDLFLILSPLVRRKLRNLVSHEPWVSIVYPYLFPSCYRLRKGLPLIYWSHNCEANLAETWTCSAPFFTKAWVQRLILGAESKAFKESSMVIACSQEDITAMETRYGSTDSMKVLIPNGVDTEGIRPATAQERRDAKLSLGIYGFMATFIASASWLPNIQAARFIMDRLARSLPEVTFCIAGTVGLDLIGKSTCANLPNSFFGEGWYLHEFWKNTGVIRWMERDAVLRLPESGGGRLHLLVTAPTTMTAERLRRFFPILPIATRKLEIYSEGHLLDRHDIHAGVFAEISVDVPNGSDSVRFKSLQLNQPTSREPRRLGLAMTHLRWAPSAGKEQSIPMEGIFQLQDAPENLCITGWMSDSFKKRVLHASDMALNPMFEGSGSNIKMLEFMAAGLPIISTPRGIRGIDLEPNIDVIVTEGEQMSSAIRSLIRDQCKAAALGRAAASKARSVYSWESLGKQLAKELERMEQARTGRQD